MERDDARRAADYVALQRDVLQASPYVIMFEAVEATAERAAVSGWAIGPSAAANFYAPISKE